MNYQHHNHRLYDNNKIVACYLLLTLYIISFSSFFLQVLGNINYDEEIEIQYETYRAELLQSWLKENGAEFDSLGVTYAISEGRGVVAEKNILSRETIAILPKKVLITTPIVLRLGYYAKRAFYAEYSPWSGSQYLQEHISMAVFIMEQRLNENSFFYAYLDTLPKDSSHLPMFYKENDFAEFTGSEFPLEVINMQQNARGEFNDLISLLGNSFKQRFTVDDYLWARATILSRAFRIYPEGHLDESLEINKNKCTNELLAMVPMADMLNHRATPNVVWTFDPDLQGFTLIATRDILPGEPIYDSYGSKSNTQYLKNFGFALKDADTSLTFTMYRSDISDVCPITQPQDGRPMPLKSGVGKCHRLPAWKEFLMDLYDVPYAKSITLNRAMDANTEEFIDHLKSAMPDYLPENERGYYSMILLYTKMSILKNDNNNYHNNGNSRDKATYDNIEHLQEEEEDFQPITKDDLIEKMDTLDEEIKLTEQMLEEIRNITNNRTNHTANNNNTNNSSSNDNTVGDEDILAKLKELEKKIDFFTKKEDMLLTLKNHRKQILLSNSSIKQKFANIIVDAEQKIVLWFRNMAIAGIQTAHAAALSEKEELNGQNSSIKKSVTKKMIKKITYTNFLSIGGHNNILGENALDSDENDLLAELQNAVSSSSSLQTTIGGGGGGGGGEEVGEDVEVSNNLSFENSNTIEINAGSNSEDIMQAVQNQLQSLLSGGTGELDIGALDTALTTTDGNMEGEASSSEGFDLRSLQTALLNSLQSLGSSSTTTTTTTTTTSTTGDVSQLVYVAVATNGAPQIRLALPIAEDMEEVSTNNLLSSHTLVSSLDGLESMLHGARIVNSLGGDSDAADMNNRNNPIDPLMAMITIGRTALVKFNQDDKYYSAIITGRMEDGTYQIAFKGVHPWIKAIFEWDGPGYPTQSIMGVAKTDIFPVTSTTLNKQLYSDANCWVNMDQNLDGIPDREIKKNDVVYGRWQGKRGNMYYDGRIAYAEDDGVSYAIKYNDGDFENFVLPRYIFLRIGL